MLNDVWFRAGLLPHPLQSSSWRISATRIIACLAYAYHLTPEDIQAKLQLTFLFLKRRLQEYAEIREEIQTLSTELADQNPELLSDLDFKDILSLSPER